MGDAILNALFALAMMFLFAAAVGAAIGTGIGVAGWAFCMLVSFC